VCCQWCAESIDEEKDIDAAFERLKERGATAYTLTGGRYVNDVKNAQDAIEDAIVD
jgi:hypothetical protein